MVAKTKPVKRTRDLEKTRKEILSVAFNEVFRRSFQGVSIDDIVKKTQLTKGALFHQFPTKLDLGYALVDEVIQPMILERWIDPIEAFENPVDGILHQIEELIGKADPRYLRYGCPLNNLMQEMAPVDAGFRDRLQSALRLWISGVEVQLRRGKREGQIKKEVHPKDAAHFIVMAHEGLYGILKGLDDPSAFKSMYRPLKTYLRTLEN
ncbi:MAG: TetR/AcrR family transcriptional regulator [Bdellovibrionales bacterium]|nr:TetR/AcrR family transcriptional regulator [Bdellovibrionales bacterium]